LLFVNLYGKSAAVTSLAIQGGATGENIVIILYFHQQHEFRETLDQNTGCLKSDQMLKRDKVRASGYHVQRIGESAKTETETDVVNDM
jgi:hypothetical protein